MCQDLLDAPAVIAASGSTMSADVVGREAGIGTGGVVGGRATVGRGAGGARGAEVTEFPAQVGVSRQSVHAWVSRYLSEGVAGLADWSSRAAVVPASVRPGGRAAGPGSAGARIPVAVPCGSRWICLASPFPGLLSLRTR